MSFFISTAQAAAEGAGQASPGIGAEMMQFGMLAVFAVVFYLVLWRPQSKRNKEHKALISAIGKGDEVITSGGLAGKVVRVDDDFAVVEIADKVEVKVQKPAITAILPKGTLKAV
ncbi:MAG: preprotein translocase subunit YajC [Pseudomonadales bacterium]|nr:preprotein translocase subunit YajC [Pseudomonadales bacterium]